jgi:outer membrane protein assembly factor BamB
VFITSWSGKYSQIPTLTNFYDKMNNMLNKVFGNHNKLYALDINNGNEIWDPINLPAGSFSAPAVDNDIVFVGCDNIDGPSLFAFNEYNGEQIWNKSVGLVGRSSPVVGTTDDNTQVGSGIYFVRMLSGKFNAVRKIMLMK